jgi:TAT (twin-arginine translocation) pathway signal sequence
MSVSKAQHARRQFLKGSAAVSLGAASLASASPHAGLITEATAGSVLLHDPRIELNAETVSRLNANGVRILALHEDPVRLWRSEQGAELRNPNTRLLGVTRWADLLIVRGLAAETRRHVRHERYDAGADHFVWLIS